MSKRKHPTFGQAAGDHNATIDGEPPMKTASHHSNERGSLECAGEIDHPPKVYQSTGLIVAIFRANIYIYHETLGLVVYAGDSDSKLHVLLMPYMTVEVEANASMSRTRDIVQAKSINMVKRPFQGFKSLRVVKAVVRKIIAGDEQVGILEPGTMKTQESETELLQSPQEKVAEPSPPSSHHDSTSPDCKELKMSPQSPLPVSDEPAEPIIKESAGTLSGSDEKKPPAQIDLELFSDDLDLDRAECNDFSPTPPKSVGGGKRKAPSCARKSVGKQRRGYEASTSDETDSFEATPRIKKPRMSEHGSAAKIRAKQAPTNAEKPKEEFNLPETPEDQLKADVDGQPGQLLPGARVLARWPDKNFYGGRVLHRDGFGRYRVRYLDGIVRDMPVPDVIPIIDLKEGHELMVSVDFEDGEVQLEPVIIVKCPSISNSLEWFDATYAVANTVTEKQEFVSWEKFVIDKDQVKNYVKTPTNKSAQEIDKSNIELSEGRPKRNRIQVTPLSCPTYPPTPRRKPATFFEQREEPDLTVSSPTSVASAKHAASSRKSSAPAVATEQAPAAKRGSRKCKDPDSQSTIDKEFEAEDGVEDEGQVVIPVALLEGKKFVLTSANRRARQNEEAESRSDERPPIPFNKKQVRQMIEEAGGTVVQDLATHIDTENCFLVADTHYRTHKYLSALVRAVPCVSHIWIYKQRQEGRKLSPMNYLLPAGVSLEKNTFVEWHANCPSLLKGLTVLVYTANMAANPSDLDFVQIWSPLVSCMGANVIAELPTDGTKVNILLTDNSCSPDVLEAVEELGGYAVSAGWLIQAIITGELPTPDAHQKYKYDFVEQSAADE